METPKRTSPNGKLRLLSFLSGLLEDPSYKDVIMWTNQSVGEFQLLKPHRVAELWGAATGNPRMNYDKMSRGLRYFYDTGSLKKMRGKNSGYKFLDNSYNNTPDTSLFMVKTEPIAAGFGAMPTSMVNFGNVLTMVKPDMSNQSLSNSPTGSSSSSTGSISPINAAQGESNVLTDNSPTMPLLGYTNPAVMAQLVSNLTLSTGSTSPINAVQENFTALPAPIEPVYTLIDWTSPLMREFLRKVTVDFNEFKVRNPWIPQINEMQQINYFLLSKIRKDLFAPAPQDLNV